MTKFKPGDVVNVQDKTLNGKLIDYIYFGEVEGQAILWNIACKWAHNYPLSHLTLKPEVWEAGDVLVGGVFNNRYKVVYVQDNEVVGEYLDPTDEKMKLRVISRDCLHIRKVKVS